MIYRFTDTPLEHGKKAVQAAQKSVELDPEDARARIALARAFFAIGQPEKAIPECKTAIKVNPHSAVAHFVLGAAIAHSGRSAEAIPHIETAIRLSPNDIFIGAFLARLGQAYLALKEYEKAISEGKKAITLDPNYASGHWLLGTSLRFAGRFDEAIDMYKRAMRLNPGYPTPYLNHLAQCYTDAGFYEKAIAAFNQLDTRCKQGEGPLWWAPIGLARTYAELGKDEAARAYVQEALKINPKLSLKSFRPPYTNPAHS